MGYRRQSEAVFLSDFRLTLLGVGGSVSEAEIHVHHERLRQLQVAYGVLFLWQRFTYVMDDCSSYMDSHHRVSPSGFLA